MDKAFQNSSTSFPSVYFIIRYYLEWNNVNEIKFLPTPLRKRLVRIHKQVHKQFSHLLEEKKLF